ncbi:HTH CENPB-type domain-containing protein [Nephila pilipes]|uniref:HTH CENPB-type domain-containing protein n=1 Tax=Nephila pilipes TaxID=299642 RepID=A0A8X6Q9H1_NEPPI|nr:HTH CENPB-type domain-containing protein [Nephila pilipes]
MKRYQLQIGKSHEEAVSTDTDAAEKYPEIFHQLIKEKIFRPEQIFNMDEAGMFWEKMPSKTFLMKDEMKFP